MRLGRGDCGRFESAIRKEWLVTNGLGGFASGTVAGLNTRRYHGLLVAALRPPQQRTLTVAKIDTRACYDDTRYPLFTNEFGAGTIDPHGYRCIESFHLDHLIPVWTWALADARLEQRIWMDHGHNTVRLSFTLARATGPVSLTATPLVTWRDFHGHTRDGGEVAIDPIAGGVAVRPAAGAQPCRIVADRGAFRAHPDWYWGFRHRMEAERGLDEAEDLFSPGSFTCMLRPGETLTFSCSLEDVAADGGRESLARERARQADLLRALPAEEPAWIRHLTLAADQFVVRRSLADGTGPTGAVQAPAAEEGNVAAGAAAGRTIIAGYPWFGDWGRDTMIALPGLTLTTGRAAIAADILRTFRRYLDRGMLPNRFPDGVDHGAVVAEYNTVDATLWYFHAVHQYLLHTGDLALVAELFPALAEIVDWHRSGARHAIRVDADDGLLYAGEPGVQLTWMDAKVGDWVVTPRIGKPVEVNALWHNALRVLADLAHRLGAAEACARYRAAAEQAADSFRRRFWYSAGGYLYDVIDGPEGEPAADGRRCDHRLRPNQIFAVSLPFPLLVDAQAKAVVDVCGRRLWTSYGLRSLAPADPAYVGRYSGGPAERDAGYHRGTVWGWLLGPFATAHYRVYRDPAATRGILAPLKDHLADAGLGTISEIFDGDPPHLPCGCVAQAWSVAEVLRAWRQLPAAGPAPAARVAEPAARAATAKEVTERETDC